ncbi:hypothetical protein DICVIV_07266 [Dictyocaulus viviparus]|uniref:Uncharacterized protein n=1 Tax=Dictyocaulus viviparus TaxID=29172 RepID=A0A0D8XPT0_DICVI|nr:hypothetical protein DICVIV_07266 [Dictyocaulus viviparus]
MYSSDIPVIILSLSNSLDVMNQSKKSEKGRAPKKQLKTFESKRFNERKSHEEENHKNKEKDESVEKGNLSTAAKRNKSMFQTLKKSLSEGEFQHTAPINWSSRAKRGRNSQNPPVSVGERTGGRF